MGRTTPLVGIPPRPQRWLICRDGVVLCASIDGKFDLTDADVNQDKLRAIGWRFRDSLSQPVEQQFGKGA
jgi:hypothetical protein